MNGKERLRFASPSFAPKRDEDAGADLLAGLVARAVWAASHSGSPDGLTSGAAADVMSSGRSAAADHQKGDIDGREILGGG